MKSTRLSFLATATIVVASLLIPTAGAHAAPQSPTIQAETTAVGQLSISLTDATASQPDGNLIYRDLTGAVIENESTVVFVESGGTASVVTPTQIVLTAPPVENATPSSSLRSGQPFTGSWDECMSGYIAGGGNCRFGCRTGWDIWRHAGVACELVKYATLRG
jgi:hypothetical protein